MSNLQWQRYEPQPDTPDLGALWQRLLGSALCGIGLAALLASGWL